MPYGKEAFMKTMICCFSILLVILIGAPVQAENWELYDNFKGGFFNHGYIDPERWAGLVLTNLVPPYLWVGENAMEIQFGRFHIRNHAYGGIFVSPSAFIEEDLYIRKHEGIKGLKATLNVLAAEVSSCPSSPTAFLPRSLARVLGHFLKDSADGFDVAAFLFADRSNNSTEAFNVLKVGYAISKCINEFCTGYTPIVAPTYIGTVHLWENFVLSLQWDEDNNQFIFQLNKNTPVYVPFGTFLPGDTHSPVVPPAHPIRKAISALNMFTPCTTEGQEALVDVYFDNVYVLK